VRLDGSTNVPDRRAACGTTALLLVKGRFSIELSTGSFVLEREGDFAVWGPGINHSWYAEADSVVITVRWPSLPQ
jgi:quercetin dioxygenase-like cupin family protein